MGQIKNTKNYMVHSRRYMDNPHFKVLKFNQDCFIDLNALFEIVMPREPERFPEKPFRDLILVVGDHMDPQRKLPEGIRHQMCFFLFAVLFHQVGDSKDILEANKDVVVCAVASWRWENPRTKEPQVKQTVLQSSVGVLYNFLELFRVRYGYKPRSLGKNADNFFAHCLQNIETRYKKPTQYSSKILNYFFLRRVEIFGEKNEFEPKVEYYKWSIEQLHLMLPIFQNCTFISDHYPPVHEVLILDKKDSQKQQMKGKNITETQKEVDRLRKDKEFMRFMLAKAIACYEEKIELLQNNKNNTDRPS